MANQETDKLWEKLNKLWETGENKSKHVKDMYDYWNGTLKSKDFPDFKKTPTNVCKKVVETKLSNTLDAQFSLAVMPCINSFSKPETLKEQQNVADILNDEMHNVLKSNHFESMKEIVGRWGLVAGHGATQTIFDDSDKVEGDIKILDIEPSGLRWNKNAKKIDDLSFIAYQVELNPYIVKKRYAVIDGVWDEVKCKLIDEVATDTFEEKKPINKGSVVNIQSTDSTMQAYVSDSKGIVAGQTVKMVVMFLLDDTCYAPEAKDGEEEKQEKITYQSKYPNGRMIVFIPENKKKVILDDKPAPESFKNLGNVDLFTPGQFNEITGKGEVEDLTGIQDRINALWIKIRHCIKNHIRTLGIDDGLLASANDGDFTNMAITWLEGLGNDPEKYPGILTNELLNDIKPLYETIQVLKNEAMEIARINETMATGEQQPGTTSGEQVEALQESPMSSIRAIQRNFKDFMLRVGEKIVLLIQAHYTVSRMVQLSTGISIDGQTYKTARFTQATDEKGEPTTQIDLLDEAGQAAKTIKVNKDWKFIVDVVAGTEIPRSRRESANLNDRLFQAGIFGDINDIDVKEQYFRSIDLPNQRAIIAVMRKKLEETPAPKAPTIDVIMNNKELMQGFGSLLEGVTGFSKAKGQILERVGLDASADTLGDAPIQETSSRSDIKDLASIVPHKISKDIPKAEYGNKIAQLIELLHNLPDDMVGQLIGMVKQEEKNDVSTGEQV